MSKTRFLDPSFSFVDKVPTLYVNKITIIFVPVSESGYEHFWLSRFDSTSSTCALLLCVISFYFLSNYANIYGCIQVANVSKAVDFWRTFFRLHKQYTLLFCTYRNVLACTRTFADEKAPNDNAQPVTVLGRSINDFK